MDKSFFETPYINDDKTCATFKFFFEDHTLANVLRFVLFFLFMNHIK